MTFQIMNLPFVLHWHYNNLEHRSFPIELYISWYLFSFYYKCIKLVCLWLFINRFISCFNCLQAVILWCMLEIHFYFGYTHRNINGFCTGRKQMELYMPWICNSMCKQRKAMQYKEKTMNILIHSFFGSQVISLGEKGKNTCIASAYKKNNNTSTILFYVDNFCLLTNTEYNAAINWNDDGLWVVSLVVLLCFFFVKKKQWRLI